ncbi:MAG: amidohydrolase family protein [Sedimentisphaeraceae bacterium JB056]
MNNRNSEIARRFEAGLPMDHIPVIDFHTHMGRSSEYYYIPMNSSEYVLPYFDSFGIDHIVTFSINVTTDVAPKNNSVNKMCMANPQRMSSLTAIHAGFEQDWESILADGYKANTRGIKILHQYQGVEGIEVDFSAAFDYASDKNWVALAHDWGSVERLEFWAKTFPKVFFIIGHAATMYKKIVEKYDNIYQCTCASFVEGYFSPIKDMVDCMPIEKIIHGSDALDLDVATSIGPIAFADISEDAKERILGRNAIELANRLSRPLPLLREY